MRTKKQINASRSNGAKSRGPATSDGKAQSAKNALRHGLSCQVVVLSNENSQEFNQLLQAYSAHWNPVTQIEIDLVHDIVAARWRLNRVLALEAAGLDLEMDRQRAQVDKQYAHIDEPVRCALAFNTLVNTGRGLGILSRHEARLQRTSARATAELLRLQTERRQRQRQNFTNEPKSEQIEHQQQHSRSSDPSTPPSHDAPRGF